MILRPRTSLTALAALLAAPSTLALAADRNGDGVAGRTGDGLEPDDLPAPPLGANTSAIDLERALARLNARQRAVVVLHDVEGYTHAEIAIQLDMTPANSKVTLFRARGALRRMLADGESG